MADIFLKLLNMSITAGYLVFAVLLARLFLKKSPKWISCLLWGIVAVRLLLPITIESPLSLIPSAQVIPENIATSAAPAIHSGIPAVNSTINPMMTQGVIQSGNMWETILSVAAVVWAVGMAGIMLYGIISYLILLWQVRARIRQEDGVYVSDAVSSPFILGFFRPKIYLPSGLDPQTMNYVLLHEKIHLQRKDHWWKPLGYFLLAVYWFNPLLWVAYILLCRDIEQSCDEKVVSQMSVQDKQGYSLALVSCSQHRRMIMVCPVAFGQVSVKTRVRAIVSYKKPTFWIMLSSFVLCAAICVCFLTNPETCIHAYADQVIQPATCTQMGVAAHTCKLCNYSYTEPLAMCKHTDGELTTVKEPTCVAVGQATTACIHCGAEYTVELPINADAHHLEEHIVKESTCTEEGEGILVCTRCSYEEPVSYALIPHNMVRTSYCAPTCRQRECFETTCTECGYEEKDFREFAGHKYVSGICWWCGAMQPGYNHGGGFNFYPFGDKRNTNTNPWTDPIIWDVSDIMRPIP